MISQTNGDDDEEVDGGAMIMNLIKSNNTFLLFILSFIFSFCFLSNSHSSQFIKIGHTLILLIITSKMMLSTTRKSY